MIKGCLTVILGLLFPRFTLLLLYVFSSNFDVFHTTIWPLVGFILAPYATLVWMFGAGTDGISGLWAVIWAIALVGDIALKPVKVMGTAGVVAGNKGSVE